MMNLNALFRWGTFAALLACFFTACTDAPEDPKPAGEITITDIPQTITTGGATTFKIYVSLSDEADHTKPHKAQGAKELTAEDFANGATVKLYNPPPNASEHPDPDLQTGGEWSGTASYYSVTITPNTVSTKADIKALAGMTFNDSKKRVSWNSLMNAMTAAQLDAIFTLIVCKDTNDITVNP